MLVTQVTDERPAFIPCSLLCPQVTYSTLHPSFSCFALRIHLRTIQTWRRHCFSFDLTLFFAFVSFSWLYCCSFPVTTCTRLGLGCFYRLLWLHNNTALTLPKWRLKWAKVSYFGLLARWRAIAIFVYNVMICGHIILRIIIIIIMI